MAASWASNLPTGIFKSLNFCKLGPRTITMTELFKLWMIYHFAQSETIVEPLLKDKLWRKDVKETAIVIEPHTRYDVSMTESRPAIIIKRLAWKQVSLGISDVMMGELPLNGDENYANYWQGGHVLFCIAGTPGQAEILGTEVFEDLNRFSQTVRAKVGLHKLKVTEIGEVAKLEESGKNHVVPVSVGYALEDAWQVQQDVPFLKRIDVSVLGL